MSPASAAVPTLPGISALMHGAPFDPVKATREMHLYPVDVVDALRDLGDGPKRLYSKLFRMARTIDRRKNPWPGYLYASERFLADELGKSTSQVQRDLAALRATGLIRVERPNKAQNNRYYFLWSECFDTADMRPQEPEAGSCDAADMRSGDTADMRPHLVDDTASMRGHDTAHMRCPIKEKPLEVSNTPERARASEGGFPEFQAAYPKQKREIALDSSCRAYLSVVHGKQGEHERLMEGLARYNASAEWQRRLREKPDGSTIPTMATFIGEHRYWDNPPSAEEVADDRSGPSARPPGSIWDPVTEEYVPVGARQ